MPLFGSHVSVAGGLHKAVERAGSVGCECIQIFTSAPGRWPVQPRNAGVASEAFSTKRDNQWVAKPLSEEAVSAWKEAYAASSLRHPIAHASYLINLAAPDDGLWQKSIEALRVELQRGDLLELEGLVVHPGAFTSSSEAEGLQRIVDGIHRVFEKTSLKTCRLLLENTAGQGSCLGHKVKHLGWLLEHIDDGQQLGVCFDTCHAFAAGYDISDAKGFRAMMREIKSELPAGSIKALHLNDSKKPCGSRVDRHEHIGRGCIGDEGFLHLFSESSLGHLPGYLETAKGEDPETGENYDCINLRRLRSIAAQVG